MQLKIAKFGGSSLASAEQFKKVKNIITSDERRRYVVPSAPGKRFSKDTKVTDMLYACHAKAENGEDFSEDFKNIKARFEEIKNELSLSFCLEEEFSKIEENFRQKCSSDYAASRGEYLNGLLLANYLGFDFIDAADVIFFDENGMFIEDKSYAAIQKAAENSQYAVIPGFYGSLPDKSIKTFSRGGSDITGSIVSRALHAYKYENWTDVSGFLMADPRIVKNPKPIKYITYRELRELSYMGAGVLHDEAIFPVRKMGIPIVIKNTNSPQDSGTEIVASADNFENKDVITGIAGKKDFSVITVEKDLMNQEVGFGKRLLEAFSKNNICFEHLPSGIDTMSVVVAEDSIKDLGEILYKDICDSVNPDHLSTEHGIALIAVVGRGMIKNPGTAAKIFSAISDNDINISMIDQGSSELNIIIGVKNEDFERSINAIYSAFNN